MSPFAAMHRAEPCTKRAARTGYHEHALEVEGVSSATRASGRADL